MYTFLNAGALRISLITAIIAVMVFAVGFAASPAQVAGEYIEPQEKYELNKLSAWGKDYWIITVDGVEMMMIGDDSKVMMDTDSIAAVLVQNIWETSGVDEKTARIRELIRAFNESEYPERVVCERITGVDAMPCYDKESCIKACYRVPLCAMQIRDDLIYSIMSWNIQRKAVDNSILAASEKAKNPKTEEDYRELCRLIQNMSDTMKIMDDNKLYDYPYCEEMHPTYDNANEAKGLCEDIVTTLATVPQARERAAKIKVQTDTRIKYLETREKTYLEEYGAVYDLYNSIKSMYSKADWKDNATEASIKSAENYTTEISQLKNDGKYKLAIKLAGQYKSILTNLKAEVQMTNAQYELMKSKAKADLDAIVNARKKLNGTKYDKNLTNYSNEIKEVLGRKVNKSEITELTKRMDEIDASVKMMVAEAVLNNEIVEEDKGKNVLPDIPINTTMGEKVGGSDGVLCGIIRYLNSLLGFSIDFLRLCK
ncbi:MAG: hypothetical protein QXS93_02145 [Candidatus Micrarchaeia archaeon]